MRKLLTILAACMAVTTSVHAQQTPDPDPTAVVEQYLQLISKQLPKYEHMPPMMGFFDTTRDNTKKLWDQASRVAQRDHIRSISFLSMFRPSEWQLKQTSKGKWESTVSMTFDIGNPEWSKMMRQPTISRQLEFKLTSVESKWKLSGFKPMGFVRTPR